MSVQRNRAGAVASRASVVITKLTQLVQLMAVTGKRRQQLQPVVACNGCTRRARENERV